ncbi:YcaO-like family protein [Haloferacaceae archaeon DSL9]
MNIGLVGTGPAIDAVRGACVDIDATVVDCEPDALDDVAAGVVVAPTGARAFEVAGERLDRWIAVEIGGIGGRVVDAIDASVSVFDADSGCYRCLRQRVAATTPESDSAPSGDRSGVRFAGAVAGRSLIRLLTGEDLGGTVTEVPGPERRFLPVPGCNCAGPSASPSSFALSFREGSLDDSLARAERAMDDRVGPISEVGERESFPVPYYIAVTADTQGFSDARAAEFAAGVDVDWDRAFMKALGEGLERYSAGVYRTRSFTTAPESNVSQAVSPRRFVRPDGFEAPSMEARIEWVDGIDLRTDERVSLPAEFVHFPPPARRYKPGITTGLGLGNSTVEATLSGLYEVIERDATMLAWYSTFEPLGLTIDDPGFEELRKRASAESLTATPLLVTQDVDVPVVAVAVHRDARWPNFAMGSGADFDPVAAARAALAEALQNWMELRAMGRDAAADQEGAIGEYADFPPIARRFVDVDGVVAADTLGDDSLAGRDELDALVDALAAVDLDAYASRVTPRDVARLGFEAVRAVVPEAQPLFTGEPYFGDRSREVPESMGFESRTDRPYHPYP